MSVGNRFNCGEVSRSISRFSNSPKHRIKLISYFLRGTHKLTVLHESSQDPHLLVEHSSFPQIFIKVELISALNRGIIDFLSLKMRIQNSGPHMSLPKVKIGQDNEQAWSGYQKPSNA